MLKKGAKDGKGVFYYDNGNAYYNGQWKNDQKHGHGLLISAEEVYEGQWSIGKKQGNGRLIDNKNNE